MGNLCIKNCFSVSNTGFPRYSWGLRSLKSSSANTKTPILSLKRAKIDLKRAAFPRYSRFLSPRIVKTVNTKTANSEGFLYHSFPQRVTKFGNLQQGIKSSKDMMVNLSTIVFSFRDIFSKYTFVVKLYSQ